MTDWHYATLIEAADAIRSRKISPVELTNALLERIARLDPSLHSYANVTPELASAQARRAEREIAAGFYRGPLHGIPVAVKDICNTAGVVTAAGMAIHVNHVPDFDVRCPEGGMPCSNSTATSVLPPPIAAALP